MITDEQIKNLKPGDPLIVHGKFDSIYDDGDIAIEIKTMDRFSDEVIKDTNYFHRSCVSMPPTKPIEIFHTTEIPETYPKYDPCRKFRKGDIVRLREYNGRKPYDYWHKQVIKNFGAKLDTVLEDELDSGNVDIFQDAPIDELTVRVNSCHLELVTPVEELEPYYIIDDDCNVEHPFFVIQNRKSKLSSGLDEEIMRFVYGQNYTADKETVLKRAVDYCARLNAEYRKEQK